MVFNIIFDKDKITEWKYAKNILAEERKEKEK